jgi:hypothetical protein
MPHAIIRGENGRRHQVDFGDTPVRVEIHTSEETVEIFIEADFDGLPNIPHHFYSEATRRSGKTYCKAELLIIGGPLSKRLWADATQQPRPLRRTHRALSNRSAP